MSDVDVTEVRALAAAIENATRKVQAGAYPTAKALAVGMTDDWRRRWTGMRALPHLAGAVTSDVRLSGLRGVEIEVGPDKGRRQGALGNIAEFGGSQHGPIRPAGAVVLKASVEAAERLLGELGKRAL